MPVDKWKHVKREHVLRAIEIFFAENPEYPSPRSTFLVYDGKKLPAKHIRGMAYQVANGTAISKEDYAGGMETVRFFERLGFEVFYTGSVARPKVKKTTHYPLSANQIPLKPAQMPIKKLAARKSPAEQPITNPKIVISSKGVTEQKNALQLLLNRMFSGDVVCEKTFPWLKTPTVIEGEYVRLCDALSAYRGNTGFAKKNIPLRCDFVCEGQKLIIEYDERQHFSQARKIALEAYKSVPLCYDRDLWIKACSDIQAKDGDPANRDEIRAFYDSTRDMEAARNGYRLIRLMHGQIDFEQPDAPEKLASLLSVPAAIPDTICAEPEKQINLKIAMYLQTEQHQNKVAFQKAMPIVKAAKVDILVFPETCWVPFHSMLEHCDIVDKTDINQVFDTCVSFSRDIGSAVVVSSIDRYGTIFSVFANAAASKEETQCAIYLKHTMTSYSPFEFKNYQSVAKTLFTPILFKGCKIGLTICYDCNHALFSRMYGVQSIDIILNSTGGNIIYDKWYKYNQVRAIENHCYTLVTMGGDGEREKVNSYVYGFNRCGKELIPRLINGDDTKTNNVSGGIYLYDLAQDDGGMGCDTSIQQSKTENKKQDFFIPVGNVDLILKKATTVDEHLYVYPQGQNNLVFCVVENQDIFHAEAFLPLLYSPKLSGYGNKRYVLVCKYKDLTPKIFASRLSVVLKVRAMENFCAVVLESDCENNCYQTGMNKTAQILKPVNGMYGLDLARMSGPEAIWKNKGTDCKASWRENYTWLANECKRIEDKSHN